MPDKPFPAYVGKDSYFFVSYAHDDATLVYPEMAWINQAGFDLWYDDGIRVGTVWRQAIADALSGASAMVFFATGRSTTSSHCLKELNFFLDEDKPVFVVHLDDTPLPSLLRLSLSDRQALAKSEHDQESYRSRLVSALSNVVAPAVKVASGEAPQSAMRGTGTDPPSIAILPLACLADDRELGFLAEGITGDLIARLSQRIWHIVACHREDATLKPHEIGEQRDVRYVLGGAVQRGGDRVRVTMRLTSARHGRELWAQRYEQTGTNMLEAQDQIVNTIDFDLFGPLLSAEEERLRHVPDEELDAWGLCARSQMRVTDRGSHDRVRTLLERAVARDPDFAIAHGTFGCNLATSIYHQFSRRPEEDAKLARAMADRAMALAPNNIVVLSQASMVHRVVGDPDHALHLAEHAARIAGRPGISLAEALVTAGRFEEVLALAESLPDVPDTTTNVAVASLAVGKPELALDWAKRGTTTQPGAFANWAYLACAQARLGRADDARASIARAKEILPTLTVDRFEKGIRLAWRNDDIIEPVLGALRELGIE